MFFYVEQDPIVHATVDNTPLLKNPKVPREMYESGSRKSSPFPTSCHTGVPIPNPVKG